MKKKIAAVVLALCAIAAPAQASAFNCSHPATSTVHAIPGNTEVGHKIQRITYSGGSVKVYAHMYRDLNSGRGPSIWQYTYTVSIWC